VFYAGEWGTVCDDDFTGVDAQVVCQQLFGTDAVAYATGAYFGQGSGRIWMDDLACVSDEATLWDCSRSDWGDHNCVHLEDAGVQCDSGDSSGTGIRLVEGSDVYEGRVEVEYFSFWGGVCDDWFYSDEANAVCQQVFGTDAVSYSCCSAYGSSSNGFFMDEVDCTGGETSLFDCSFDGWGVHNCFSFEYVGVACNPSSSVPAIRLVNGSNAYEGRIEVFYAGEWGTVCDDDFTGVDAQVVCQQLFGTDAVAYATGAYFGQGSGRIWMDDLACVSDEATLWDCSRSDWGDHNCFHSEDAGVQCDVGAEYFPTAQPVASPFPQPAPQPTLYPVSSPVPQPVPQPTLVPISSPVPQPAPQPTLDPVSSPVPQPVPQPTLVPISSPAPQPAPQPTLVPISSPTPQPAATTTPEPMAQPAPMPTPSPTLDVPPDSKPTLRPASSPTLSASVIVGGTWTCSGISVDTAENFEDVFAEALASVAGVSVTRVSLAIGDSRRRLLDEETVVVTYEVDASESTADDVAATLNTATTDDMDAALYDAADAAGASSTFSQVSTASFTTNADTERPSPRPVGGKSGSKGGSKKSSNPLLPVIVGVSVGGVALIAGCVILLLCVLCPRSSDAPDATPVEALEAIEAVEVRETEMVPNEKAQMLESRVLFANGSEVTVVGLSKRPELNGKSGTVVGSSGDRYQVRLKTEDGPMEVLVKAENLEPGEVHIVGERQRDLVVGSGLPGVMAGPADRSVGAGSAIARALLRLGAASCIPGLEGVCTIALTVLHEVELMSGKGDDVTTVGERVVSTLQVLRMIEENRREDRVAEESSVRRMVEAKMAELEEKLDRVLEYVRTYKEKGWLRKRWFLFTHGSNFSSLDEEMVACCDELFRLYQLARDRRSEALLERRQYALETAMRKEIDRVMRQSGIGQQAAVAELANDQGASKMVARAANVDEDELSDEIRELVSQAVSDEMAEVSIAVEEVRGGVDQVRVEVDDVQEGVDELVDRAKKEKVRREAREHGDKLLETYEIEIDGMDERPFAQGGMAQVHKARYDGHEVVMKMIPVGGLTATQRDRLLADFKRELAIITRLRSPLIVQFYGVVTTKPDFLGFCLEYMAGGTLRRRLDDDDKPISSKQERTWARQIARGMQYIYKNGIEHRDLKAANVLLTLDENAKVADFGLSRSDEYRTHSTAHTAKGAAGTAPWMAPELLDKYLFTEKSDVYSYGIVLYEIVTRSMPWAGLSQAQIAMKVVVRKHRPAIPDNVQAPPDLLDLVTTCWNQEPDQRPTFNELVRKYF